MRVTRVAVVIIALIVAGVAWAGGGAEEAEGAVAARQLKVSITGTPQSPQFEELVAEYEEEMAARGTPVQVSIDRFQGSGADYAARTTLQLRSGQAADVVVEEISRVRDYAGAGYLLPLDTYVESWKLWDQAYDAVQEISTVNGNVYGIQFQTAACPLYFRKDLFIEAGLDPEWNPRSWDDLLDAARIIKAELPDVTPFSYTGGSAAGTQVNFSRAFLLIHGAGGLLYNQAQEKWIVTSQAILDTFNFYQTMAEEGLINPSRALSGEADTWAIQAMAQGRAAIGTGGSWLWHGQWGEGRAHAVENRDDVMGYTRMPAMRPGSSANGQDFVAQSGGWSYVIPKGTADPDLAWSLIEFVSETERQARLNAPNGTVATRDDVRTHPIYDDPFLSDIVANLEYTYFEPNAVAGWFAGPDASLAESIGRIMAGDWDARRAMEEYATAVERAFGTDRVIREL